MEVYIINVTNDYAASSRGFGTLDVHPKPNAKGQCLYHVLYGLDDHAKYTQAIAEIERWAEVSGHQIAGTSSGKSGNY